MIMCGAAERQSFASPSGVIELDAPWELEIITGEYTIPGDLVKTEFGCQYGYCDYAFRKPDDRNLMFELSIYDDEPFTKLIEEDIKWGEIHTGEWTATNNGQDIYWARKISNNKFVAYINLTNNKTIVLSPWDISNDPETFLAISKSFKLTNPLSVPGFEALLALIGLIAAGYSRRR